MEQDEWSRYVIAHMDMKGRVLNIAVQGWKDFLQMCAELNMVVTNITTVAANFFHALRRQLLLVIQ